MSRVNNLSSAFLNNNQKASSMGLPSSMEGMVNSNPYKNQDYQLGIWDRIGNFFGFRTQEDQWREELALKAKEYDAQLQSVAFENEYNSPEQQAERMRNAGMNPDLLGTNGVSTAAEFSEPQETMLPPGASDVLPNMASGIATVITTGIGLAQGFESLRGMRLDNEQKSVSQLGSFMDMAQKFLLGTVPSETLLNLNNSHDIETDAPIIRDIKEQRIKAGYTFSDPKLDSKFDKFLTMSLRSPEFRKKLFENLSATETARNNAFKSYGKSDEEMNKALLPLFELEQNIYKSNIRLQLKKNELDKAIYDSKIANGIPAKSAALESISISNQAEYQTELAKLHGASELAQTDVDYSKVQRIQNEYNKLVLETNKNMLDEQSKVIKKLMNDAKNGSWLSGQLLQAMSILNGGPIGSAIGNGLNAASNIVPGMSSIRNYINGK